MNCPCRRAMFLLVAIGLTVGPTGVPGFAADDASAIKLALRYRTETAPGSGRYHALHRKENWKPNQTAIIVCDMWDLHHCLNATKRGAELAPRMNRVINEARKRGVTIIHAPSSCMPFYKDHPLANEQ